MNYFGTTVPQTVSSPKTDQYGTYLLLNSEIQNDTIIIGFQFYGETAGSIIINVFKIILLVSLMTLVKTSHFW